MKPELPELFRVTPKHVKAVAAMMSAAFYEYPLTVWFYPDPAERLVRAAKGFESMLRFGVTYGEVYAVSPALEGAAFWVHSEKSAMTRWRNFRSGNYSAIIWSLRKVPPRIKSYSEYSTAVHHRCAPFPHMYLRILAVDPAHRDQGFSGRLLKPMFARLDSRGLPCYLETQAERNVAIYEHFGFKVMEEGLVPGSDVRSWGMLRKTG
jgi:GNAT superfamily N-acetyltransferase